MGKKKPEPPTVDPAQYISSIITRNAELEDENTCLKHENTQLREVMGDLVAMGKKIEKLGYTPASAMLNDARRQQILNQDVSEFADNERIKGIFMRLNIGTVCDLVRKTEGEFRAKRNCGEDSVGKIKDKLRSLGLKLGMNEEEISEWIPPRTKE